MACRGGGYFLVIRPVEDVIGIQLHRVVAIEAIAEQGVVYGIAAWCGFGRAAAGIDIRLGRHPAAHCLCVEFARQTVGRKEFERALRVGGPYDISDITDCIFQVLGGCVDVTAGNLSAGQHFARDLQFETVAAVLARCDFAVAVRAR